MTENTIVLDAMGVIYASSDDVAELLVPFVIKAGGIKDLEEIARQYTLASLGKQDAEMPSYASCECSLGSMSKVANAGPNLSRTTVPPAMSWQ